MGILASLIIAWEIMHGHPDFTDAIKQSAIVQVKAETRRAEKRAKLHKITAKTLQNKLSRMITYLERSRPSEIEVLQRTIKKVNKIIISKNVPLKLYARFEKFMEQYNKRINDRAVKADKAKWRRIRKRIRRAGYLI